MCCPETLYKGAFNKCAKQPNCTALQHYTCLQFLHKQGVNRSTQCTLIGHNMSLSVECDWHLLTVSGFVRSCTYVQSASRGRSGQCEHRFGHSVRVSVFVSGGQLQHVCRPRWLRQPVCFITCTTLVGLGCWQTVILSGLLAMLRCFQGARTPAYAGMFHPGCNTKNDGCYDEHRFAVPASNCKSYHNRTLVLPIKVPLPVKVNTHLCIAVHGQLV